MTDSDYCWMVEHMDAAKRAATFEGDDVYRLVTTRRLRDEAKLSALGAANPLWRPRHRRRSGELERLHPARGR